MFIALAKRVLSNYIRQHVGTNTDNSWKRGEKKGSLDEGRQDEVDCAQKLTLIDS